MKYLNYFLHHLVLYTILNLATPSAVVNSSVRNWYNNVKNLITAWLITIIIVNDRTNNEIIHNVEVL